MLGKKILFLMFLFFMIGMIFYYLKNYDSGKKQEKKIISEEIKKIQTAKKDKIKGFVLKGIKDTKIKWELNGEGATLDIGKSEEIFIYKPLMKIFNANVSQTANVTADIGQINAKTKNMHAMGNVVMHSLKENTKLYTDEVFFDNNREKFYSDKKVKIIRDDSITTGVGFESDINLAEITIKKNIVISYQKSEQ